MNKKLLKLACVTVTLSMVLSVTACKKDSKKKSSGVQAAAEEALDAMISRKSKSISKLGDIDDELIDFVDEIADVDFISVVMDKASYEIDEDSIEDKKKEASCDAVVKIPDYEDAFEAADGDMDDFEDEIDGQKEKNYKEIEVTLEFDKDDDEYSLTNAEDVLGALYEDIVDFYTENAFGSVPTDKPTDPDVDPTTGTTNDDPDPTTTPGGGTTQALDLDGFRTITNVPELQFAYPDFETAINATNDGAAKNLYDNDPSWYEDMYPGLTRYVSAYSDQWTNIYDYYEFDTPENAQAYWEDNVAYYSSIAKTYDYDGTFGYCFYAGTGYIFDYYLCGNAVIEIFSSPEDQKDLDAINNFWHALNVY